MMMLVRDMMSMEAPCVSKNTSMRDAAEMVNRECVSELYVTDDDGRLMGVIADYDLLKALYMESADERAVSEFMSCQVLSCSADEDVNAVLPLFREQRCRVIAVVREQKVIGQIFRRDMLSWIVMRNGTERGASHELTNVSMNRSVPVSQSNVESRSNREEASIPTPRFLRNRPSVISSDFARQR